MGPAEGDHESQRSSLERLEAYQRNGSLSPTATLTSHAEKLEFDTDSEAYSVVPSYHNEARQVKPLLKRSNTIANTKSIKASDISNNGGGSKKWGYGWGMGIGKKDKEKRRDKELPMIQEKGHMLDLTDSDGGPPHYRSRSPYESASSQSSHEGLDPEQRQQLQQQMQQAYPDGMSLSYTNPTGNHPTRSNTFRSNVTGTTGITGTSKHSSKRSGSSRTASSGKGPGSGRGKFTEQITAAPAFVGGAVDLNRRPTYHSTGSSNTLVGSALERKANDVDTYTRHDTTDRLNALRELMKKDNLDY